MNKKIRIGLLFFCLTVVFYGQEDEGENLATQQVTVIKSYNPSLSEAFQIKTTPEIPDSIATEKLKVSYDILSLPVIETFEPNKANPLELIRTAPEKLYNTLFGIGYGSMGQLYIDFSTTVAIDREQQFGLMLYRDGFENNIGNSLLKSNQNYLFFGLQHALKNNNFRGDSKLSYYRSRNNYYGLLDEPWNPIILSSVEPEIKRNFVSLNSQWQWYDGILEEVDFKVDLTTDNFSSSEQKMNLVVKTKLPLFDGDLSFNANLGGVSSRFEQDYFNKLAINSQLGNGGVELAWRSIETNLKIKIGVGGAYIFSDSLYGTALQFYPRVEISYNVEKAKIIPFIKANGRTSLANYSDFSTTNPFLYPGLDLQPLWQKYNARAGLRSKQFNVLLFEFSIGYDEQENLPLFKRLPFDPLNNDLAFRFSNAFEVEYANISQIDFNAQLGFDFSRENHLDFKIQYLIYDLKGEGLPWNLPQLKIATRGQFKWSKFSLSLEGKMIGVRLAAQSSAQWPIILELPLDESRIDSSFDLPIYLEGTVMLNYKIKEPFDLFLNARVSTSATHGIWGFYPQPNSLIMAGFRYKFNL
tara:strand:- start:5817 stop:7565 length:1749 start_codon:yes stop_codon:yes gene_type:complete